MEGIRKNVHFVLSLGTFYHGTSYRLGCGQHPLIDQKNQKNQKKNLTELNILESSRTFYGILEQSRTV